MIITIMYRALRADSRRARLLDQTGSRALGVGASIRIRNWKMDLCKKENPGETLSCRRYLWLMFGPRSARRSARRRRLMRSDANALTDAIVQ